jgi:type VII secretion integral membrane protein EccD
VTAFTRVTVVGRERRADVVVPSNEPYAGLLPRFTVLLGDGVDSSAALVLVRVTGEQVDLAGDSASQQIGDGELLHLVDRSDAPPPPEVFAVTDTVSESLSSRTDRWTAASSRATAAVLVAVAVAVAGLVSRPALSDHAGLVSAVAAAVLLVSVVAGRTGRRWTAVALTAAGVGASLPLAVAVGDGLGVDEAGVVLPAAALWAALSLGAGPGIGLGVRPAGWAAAVAAVFAVVPVLASGTTVPAATVWGAVGVAAVVLLGLLPSFALAAAGVTGLDDQVAAGEPVSRRRVAASLDDAYRGLDATCAAAAVAVAVAASVLVTGSGPWTLALGVVVLLVTALRTRSFPLRAQGLVLWAGVLVPTVLGIAAHVRDLGAWSPVALLVLALLAALVAGATPRPHQRARLRSVGNTVEAVAVVTLLPLLLGTSGLYDDLLATFR